MTASSGQDPWVPDADVRQMAVEAACRAISWRVKRLPRYSRTAFYQRFNAERLVERALISNWCVAIENRAGASKPNRPSRAPGRGAQFTTYLCLEFQSQLVSSSYWQYRMQPQFIHELQSVFQGVMLAHLRAHMPEIVEKNDGPQSRSLHVVR